MKEIFSSEPSIQLQQTIQSCIQKDRTVHSHSGENLKSYFSLKVSYERLFALHLPFTPPVVLINDLPSDWDQVSHPVGSIPQFADKKQAYSWGRLCVEPRYVAWRPATLLYHLGNKSASQIGFIQWTDYLSVPEGYNDTGFESSRSHLVPEVVFKIVLLCRNVNILWISLKGYVSLRWNGFFSQ
jgi:hypothetical protein